MTSTTTNAASLSQVGAEDFGPTLIAARKKAGLKQNELAGVLGLSTRTLMRWEGGQAMPRVDVRDAIVGWLRSQPTAEAERALAAVGALFVRAAPVAPPPPHRPEETRTAKLALEHAIYRAAEELDVPARAARRIVLAALAAAEAEHLSTSIAHALLVT